MNGSGRPTAVNQRVDLSVPGHGASAVHSSTEDALFHGYSRMRSRISSAKCVCGGWVRANPSKPGPGVQQHNTSSRHQAWRATREDGTEPWVIAA